jgi:hypothetical protein
LICLSIGTLLLFSFIAYKLGVKYIKPNSTQLCSNTSYIIIALVAISIILLSIPIFIYYDELVNLHSYLLSLDNNYMPRPYILDDDGLRHSLHPDYNVLTRRDAGEKIAVEAACFEIKHGRLGTLGEIGRYNQGIYHREFRHVLPHVEN